MSKKKNIKPFLVYALSIPIAALYVILILITSSSFVAATTGYIVLGISFGLIQSLFTINRPYRVAFFSTIGVPIMAYAVFALISGLIVMGLSSGFLNSTNAGGITSIPLSGDILVIDPLPYTAKLGVPLGISIYAVVLVILIIPFGFIGIAGRFLGSELIPNIIGIFSKRKIEYKKQDGGILIENANDDIEIEKISSKTTIIAAIITAVASILVAVIG